MKKIIFVIIDKNGNAIDENGRAYGFFAGNEEELCKAYCKANGFDYKKSTITVL